MEKLNVNMRIAFKKVWHEVQSAIFFYSYYYTNKNMEFVLGIEVENRLEANKHARARGLENKNWIHLQQ